jgi:hypothetical protein
MASDLDGPGQTWSLLGSDTCGGSIVPVSGVYNFTPAGPTPPPSCVVGIQVCDGGVPDLCDTETAPVNITAVNDPPAITSTAPATATQDMLYTYNAAATDPDGPGQTWSLLGSDTCGGSIVPVSGVYTFTPVGPTPPANCVVGIQVCDGGVPDLCDTEAAVVDITINPAIPVPAAGPVALVALMAAIALAGWMHLGRPARSQHRMRRRSDARSIE